MPTHLTVCLILKLPGWSVAQRYNGIEGGGYATDSPSKYIGIPKGAREIRLSVKLDSWVLELRKNFPGQAVMVS